MRKLKKITYTYYKCVYLNNNFAKQKYLKRQKKVVDALNFDFLDEYVDNAVYRLKEIIEKFKLNVKNTLDELEKKENCEIIGKKYVNNYDNTMRLEIKYKIKETDAQLRKRQRVYEAKLRANKIKETISTEEAEKKLYIRLKKKYDKTTKIKKD